jgi:hypothetical protein
MVAFQLKNVAALDANTVLFPSSPLRVLSAMLKEYPEG